MAVGALGRGVLAPVPDHEPARGANRGVGRVDPDGELAARRGRFIRVASYDLGTIRYVLNTDRHSRRTVSCYLPDVCPGRGPASWGAGRLARGGDSAPGPAPSLAQDSRRRGWRSTGGHAALRTGCVQMPSLRC